MTRLQEMEAKAEAIDDAVDMIRARYGLDGDKIEMIYDDLREKRDDYLAAALEEQV